MGVTDSPGHPHEENEINPCWGPKARGFGWAFQRATFWGISPIVEKVIGINELFFLRVL